MVQCQMMPLKVWLQTALGCNHQSFTMFGFSGTQIHDHEVEDEGSGMSALRQRSIEPHDLVYYTSASKRDR